LRARINIYVSLPLSTFDIYNPPFLKVDKGGNLTHVSTNGSTVSVRLGLDGGVGLAE
jgi:hypothetical protein